VKRDNWLLCMLALLVVTASSPAMAQSKKPIVAVFDLEDKGVGLSKALCSRLSDYMSMTLAATGRYQVVPRDQLKKRLVQQKRDSYKQCYDQTCQIEIGKELAAQKSLTTKAMKLGSKCVVTTVLFDLKKATSERGASAEGDCSEDGIVKSIKSVVQKLGGGIVKSPVMVKKPTPEWQTPQWNPKKEEPEPTDKKEDRGESSAKDDAGPGGNDLDKEIVPSSSKVSLGASVGTGLGFLSERTTENVGAIASDVVAWSPLHVAFEFNYHISDRWHIGLYSRLQIVNALSAEMGLSDRISYFGNILAKYFFTHNTMRWYFGFGVGGGQVRYRIPIDDIFDAAVSQYIALTASAGTHIMFHRNFGLALSVGTLLLVPDFAFNLDVNTGFVFYI